MQRHVGHGKQPRSGESDRGVSSFLLLFTCSHVQCTQITVNIGRGMGQALLVAYPSIGRNMTRRHLVAEHRFHPTDTHLTLQPRLCRLCTLPS